MFLRKIFLAPVFMLISFYLLAGVSADDKKEFYGKKLVVGIPYDFKPTYFKNKQNGKADGFAVDLTKEIAKIAGFEIEFKFGKIGRAHV